METDVRPDDAVQHDTDDSEDSEFQDALEELVLASSVENVNIGNNGNSSNSKNNSPAETSETNSSQTSDDGVRKMAKEVVSQVIQTAKQKLATTDESHGATASKRNVPVATSATTTDGSRDATAADSPVETTETTLVDSDSPSVTSATTLLPDARPPGATLYEDIQADAAHTCDNLEKEQNEDCKDGAEDPEEANVSQENEEEQRDEEDFDEDDKPEDEEKDEEGEDERFVVDEEFLKEREATLTDEEKQELMEKAQELKAEGNAMFKENNYVGAVVAYTDALRTCPLACAKERSIMYSNRAACKLHMDQKESAIEDCTKALELNSNYMKCLLRRAELYEKTDKLDEALGDYQRALEVDPGLHIAREACMRLPEQIKERNEKLKEEMMGKLKDLGNLVLRPFGLSTDNFKLNQDPNTGGYSVSFQQNPGSS